MTKKDRACRLLLLVLDVEGATRLERIDCYDCMLAAPEEVIPGHAALADFVQHFCDYFLGRPTECRAHYPEAARFIDRFRARWGRPSAAECVTPCRGCDLAVFGLSERGSSRLPATKLPCSRGDDPFHACWAHGGFFWSTDLSLAVVSFFGRLWWDFPPGVRPMGAEATGLLTFFVGGDWAGRSHAAALRGEVFQSMADFRGYRWQVVVSPRFDGEAVVGVSGAAVPVSPLIPQYQ